MCSRPVGKQAVIGILDVMMGDTSSSGLDACARCSGRCGCFSGRKVDKGNVAEVRQVNKRVMVLRLAIGKSVLSVVSVYMLICPSCMM